MTLKKLTLPELLKNSCSKFSKNLSLNFVASGKKTYQDLYNEVVSIANHLLHLGVKKGDKVAILSANMPNWGITQFAIANIGAIAVPVLPGFCSTELQNILEHAEVKVIFVSRLLAKCLEGVKTPFLEHKILINNFSTIPEGCYQPEELDKLDRRLIQLKIEREAMKKETDEASKKRLAAIEAEIETLSRKYSDLEEIWKAEKSEALGEKNIRNEIDRVRQEMEACRREAKYERLSELQYAVLPKLEEKLKKTEKKDKAEDKGRPKLLRTSVGAEEIAEVVSRATGIPVAKMMEGERQKLLHMADALSKRVIGQPEAVRRVTETILRSRAGLSDPNRPYGSFLFLGPTGVGKTELTKALAEFLFDSDDAMIRIDMSEFMEKHSVARLIGAPPGYVGYEEGGYLTEAVRRKPYSVILLDEVEKAHPDVFNVLLQVLDDGRMTDGQGRTVDFKNTVIVMTSNLGSQEIQAMQGEPHDKVKDAVMQEVKQHFRPEFINRIDEIVVFNALDTKAIRAIAKIQIDKLAKRVAAQDVVLDVTDAALDEIAKVGFDPLYGARPLKRAVQEHIENEVARLLLEGKAAPKDHVVVDSKDDHFVFDVKKAN